MWAPRSTSELERAVAAGALRESPALDGKEHLPAARDNASLAVDVAAMSTDGGVLVYGVGEDEHRLLTRLAPLELAGHAERTDQVVRTGVQEVPYFETRELRLDAEPARGYLVVLVPASPRAPHQIVLRGKYQGRFYGRGATGNRVLLEGDVARLYERRDRQRFDAESYLARIVQ